jgi:hypothetical protein
MMPIHDWECLLLLEKAVRRSSILSKTLTVDHRYLSSKKKKRSPAFIADVATDIENVWQVTMKKCALAYEVPKRTIPFTLRHDLNLTKKSARLVQKLLTDDMKKERVRMSEEFLAMVGCCSMAIFDNIVTVPHHGGGRRK